MGFDPKVDLRAMVRDVLRETMAAPAQVGTSQTKGAQAAGTQTAGVQSAGMQTVLIRSDADLQALLARLMAPGVIEALQQGRLKFTLGSGSAPAISITLDGVVTERKLQGLAQGSLVRLAPGAVVTPMARDIARRIGLKLERIAE